MNCPYCGAELVCTDYYGKTKYAQHYWEHPQSWIEKTGDIYQCPNSDGFESVEEVNEYSKTGQVDVHGVNFHWEDITCESGNFNGHFYTDSNGNLHEGYPC